MNMKRKIIIGCLTTVVLAGVAALAFIVWAASVPKHKDDPALRATLEKVYTSFLDAVDREDPILLMSVLTEERMRMYGDALKQNRLGKFPDDYFRAFKPIMPKMPPPNRFRYVAVTEGDKYANLIYVGNMNGFLRKTQDQQHFLVIQFEKEKGNWKYSIVVDPPANTVPHLEDRLAKNQLYFLKFKPFKPEKIELLP